MDDPSVKVFYFFMEFSESADVRFSVSVFRISEITASLFCGVSEELSMIAEYSCSSRPASSLSLETCLRVGGPKGVLLASPVGEVPAQRGIGFRNPSVTV